MTINVTIRHLPVDAHAELTARAALRGQSLQEYLRSQLIAFAARPDVDAWIARIRERTEKTGSRLSGERILELRDQGRG